MNRDRNLVPISFKMSSLQPKELNELFCVNETIEYGNVMVTACPEIWVDGHILYWPPGEIDRSQPLPPQPDWIPTMCRVLKSSIGKPDFLYEFKKPGPLKRKI